jgi:hypothetical protein
MDMTKTADMLNTSINLLHQENFEEHNKIQQLNSTQDELRLSIEMLTLQLDRKVADQVQQLNKWT